MQVIQIILLIMWTGGMNLDVHKTVLENKEKETGCTLHLVTEEVDGGAILMQKSTQIVGTFRKSEYNSHFYQKETLLKHYVIVCKSSNKSAFWNVFKKSSTVLLKFLMNKNIFKYFVKFLLDLPTLHLFFLDKI
jgi:hypothetical protein